MLQQYLPFTVLKLFIIQAASIILSVATVLTVYGIETIYRRLIAIVRTTVATVLTVYGIETETSEVNPPAKSYKLQQYLPFTVLKLKIAIAFIFLSYCCNSTYRLRY